MSARIHEPLRRTTGASASGRDGTLEWRCDHCDQVVHDGAGYIHIDYAAIHATEEARRIWERDRPRGAATTVATSIVTVRFGDLAAYPPAVPWQVHHTRCDPHPDAGDYWFSVERCRTWPQLVEWTAHLMGKAWIGRTDWRAVLARVHERGGQSR